MTAEKIKCECGAEMREFKRVISMQGEPMIKFICVNQDPIDNLYQCTHPIRWFAEDGKEITS